MVSQLKKEVASAKAKVADVSVEKTAAPPGPIAYSPQQWSPLWLSYTQTMQHLKEEAGEASWAGYWWHMGLSLWFAFQLLIAGCAGYTHAFIAWLFPFVAEEVGVELAPLIDAKRAAGGKWPVAERAYAYQPRRWTYYIDGWNHVTFSGGSYVNHGRFACWASGQYLVGFVAGVVHAIFPALLPHVAEEIGHELGTLIRRRRMLRNQQKDNTFVNPDKLSDYYSKDYKAKFKEAEAASTVGRGGETLLDKKAIPVQLLAGEKAKFL